LSHILEENKVFIGFFKAKTYNITPTTKYQFSNSEVSIKFIDKLGLLNDTSPILADKFYLMDLEG